jgi:C-terminal processing protease CtpA/Prc
VAVLIGPATMSSCESFALMMRQAPRCKLVGASTRGSSGNPRPFDLGNGVVAWVPSWQDLDADGRLVEGQGVPPDVEVKAGRADFRAGDPVLRQALEVLRGR